MGPSELSLDFWIVLGDGKSDSVDLEALFFDWDVVLLWDEVSALVEVHVEFSSLDIQVDVVLSQSRIEASTFRMN